MADVHIRAVGSNEDALRSIAELKAALASLHNQTIRVRVEQERLRRVTGTGGNANPIQDVRRFEQARVQEVDRAERAITNTVQRETRRRQSILGGVGRDIGRAGRDLRSVLPETGPRGVGLVGAGIGAGVSMIGPLRNLTGLVGALPAVFGAAGIAAATFALVDMKAVSKAASDQEKVQQKLAAGTIKAKDAQKQMKNAVLDLTAAQRSALPWARNMAEIHDQAANTIQRKLLPAIGALGRGLEANKRTIMSTLAVGAGTIGRGLTGVGGILGSPGGRAGVSAFGRSSNIMLGAGVNLGTAGIQAFLNVAKAAQPLVNALSRDITILAARFASWTGSFTGQQALTKWFSSAEKAAVSFSHVIFNVFAALNNIAIGAQGTGGVLAFLDKITNAFANWTGSAAGQKSIGEGISAAGAALRQLGSDLQFAWGVAKPFLNTIHQIAVALRSIVPGGANTIGVGLAANFALGGLPRKLIGRGVGAAVGGAAGRAGIGGILGGIGGGVAAAGAGEAAAGAGIGMALPIAGVVALGAALVLLAAHYNGAMHQATAFAQGVSQANAAAARAASVMTGGQIHAAAQGAALNARSQAQLGAITARQAVSFDKSMVKTATGQQKVYWTIMLQLDRHSLQTALDAARKANDAVNRGAETHREDARATKDSTAATDAHIASLNKLFDVQSKVFTGAAKGVGVFKNVTTSVQEFSAAMGQQAAAFAKSDPKAAHYAASAARLAANLGRVPTKREVNVYVHGLDTAIYSIDRFKGMLASIPLSVQTVLTTINPGGAHGGRPPGYTPPRTGGSHGHAGGAYFAGTYRGVDTIPAMIAPGEAVLNPRQIDMLGRGRVMGALAKTGGSFHDASGFASGGYVSADSTLASARGYLGGSLGGAAGIAASHYTHIPKLLAADTKRRNFLIKDMDREQQLLARLRRQKAALPAGKASAGKRRSLSSRISHILQHTHEQREELKRKKAEIATLTGELGIVPGEERFQALIDDIEGQRVAATVLGSPARSKALEAAEIGDYTRRVKFLSLFTQIKGVRQNKQLYQAANVALVSRAGELDSLKGDAAGGLGGAGGAADQHTQDVIDALQTFTAQAVQMQAVSASEISTAMDFLKSQVGSFAGGTSYVPRTGMALVHQGEAIVPAWQNGSANSGSMQGEFKITGSDALTSAIARAITPSVQIEMGRTTRRLTRERRT